MRVELYKAAQELAYKVHHQIKADLKQASEPFKEHYWAAGVIKSQFYEELERLKDIDR